MTKHGCNFTSATASRGVEAKELEIANTRLDRNTNTCSSSSLPAEGSTQADSSGQTTCPTLDATGSYVQVVVQKRRRAPPPQRAAQTSPRLPAAHASPRLPAASSPIRQIGESTGAGDGVLLVPASVLLACPPTHPAFYQPHLPLYKTLGECGGSAEAAAAAGSARRDACAGDACAGDAPAVADAARTKTNKHTNWKYFNNSATDKLNLSESGPERVEVYYFEHGSAAYLAARGARATRVERAGRRAARAAGALLAEPLAAAQLLLALPVALLVSIERCILMAVRDLVTGSVQTAADYVAKPALALAFNAAVAPALACGGNVARAARAALRPAWLALGDAVEPAARLLAQLRLVQVRLEAHPRCREPCRCAASRDLV